MSMSIISPLANFVWKLLFRDHLPHPDYQTAVGGHWDEVGRLQFEFLMSEGLKPEHYLLDVACGSFRAGRFFIDYLLPAHYYAFDGDHRLLEAGIQEVLKLEGLMDKEPQIRCICLGYQPVDFLHLLKRKFDYIWVHALFDHIPPEVIASTLNGLSQVLAEKVRLYATIFLNPYGPQYLEPILHLRNGSSEGAITTHPDREYWHHTLDYFENLGEESGELLFDTCIHDYPHPLGLKVLRFLHR